VKVAHDFKIMWLRVN